MNKFSRIDFENARADVICFDNGTEVKEYQAIIHVSQKRLTYLQQLEAVMNAYHGLLKRQQRAHQLLFRHIDTETMEVGELRHRVEVEGQHDGLATMLKEERLVLKYDGH